jgi:tetratricopeptide (TPR) repeat protein
MDDTFGHDSVVKLLDGYRQGKDDDEAFTYACGKTTTEFEKDFFPWAKEQVKSWGYDKESGEKFDKLKKEAEAAKDARQYDKAIDLWEQAIAVRPLDLLGNQRLAGLYLVTKQFDKAIKSLATLDKVELMDNRYAKQAAKIFKSEQKWPEAEKYAMQAIYITPYDTSAHELLRDIYKGSGNAKGMEREERMIPILEKWTEDQKRENALRPPRGENKPQ